VLRQHVDEGLLGRVVAEEVGTLGEVPLNRLGLANHGVPNDEDGRAVHVGRQLPRVLVGIELVADEVPVHHLDRETFVCERDVPHFADDTGNLQWTGARKSLVRRVVRQF